MNWRMALPGSTLGLLLACSLTSTAAPRALENTFPYSGQPIADDIFLQETSWQIPSPAPLTSVGLANGRVFVGTAQGLLERKGDTLAKVDAVPGAVRKLVRIGETLWAVTDKGLHRFVGGNWASVTTQPVADVSLFGTNFVVVADRTVSLVSAEGLKPLTTNQVPFTAQRLAWFSDSLYLQGGNRLTFFDGRQFGGRDLYDGPTDLAVDWGSMPSTNVRDVLAFGPGLYLATDRGLGVLRGMNLTTIRGEQGLPYEDLTCLAPGFGGDLWIGSTRGAIRRTGGEYHYFDGKRWLPDNAVRGIAVEGRSVYVATDGGLAVIEYHPMTLEEKAAHYERQIEAWGQKRLGFVHKLEWEESLGEYVREVGDNDGGYSCDYLAAQCYRYAVTGDPRARAEAVNTFKSLLWLERMSGIEGFIARAVWVKGERGHKAAGGSGGYAAEWHDVKGGTFEWKADTSSDEICGHFYAVSLFLELVANDEEAAQGKLHLARMASHLIDHNWQLIDVDGKPTRWGRWDPDYFTTDEGRFDRGLQCVEILSFMKSAAHFTGQAKFSDAYANLVNLGYPGYTLRQRNIFPPDTIANFEDQLALWCYWNLIRRETDPVLKSVYRRSFERTWEIIRVEQQPWFNFVYGTLTGNDCEAALGVKHLREWPLDLTIWSFRNSQRADLRTPPGYTVFKGSPRPFSPRERGPMRWDGWTMEIDGGSGGNDVVEPAGWLLAYWMGRYHGFITSPRDKAGTEVTVQVRKGKRPGARAYEAAERPAVW